jgi:ribonuclease BN (tRNA processing enzyme)
MHLRFLGTAGYHPTDRRQTACLMLPEAGVVLDAGTGMYRAGELLQTDTLDIFLTHSHLDHVIGLTYLFSVLAGRDNVAVRVHGQASKLDAIATHLFAKPIFPALPPLHWQPLADAVPLAGNGRLSWFALDHPGGSVGYRIDWPDRSMAYVTDTTADPQADYVQRIHGVDVLVHECYFPDGCEDRARMTGHSCATPVARVARAADVKRLLLVHIDPSTASEDPLGLADMRAIFPRTEIAEDRWGIDF